MSRSRLVASACLATFLFAGSLLAQDDLAGQKERQREIQADTDFTVRRLQTLLRVLDFYQANKSAQQKALGEMAQTLAGLSKEQMTEVLARLDAAAKPEKADAERDAAYVKHREILDSLKDLMNRYDAVQNLDQAADRLEKFSRKQLELHLIASQFERDQAELNNSDLGFAERLSIERRVKNRVLESRRIVDGQKELHKDVSLLLKQIVDLKPALSEEHRLRVLNMEKLADQYGVISKLAKTSISLGILLSPITLLFAR